MAVNEELVYSSLKNLFPDAKCSLDFSTPFQCLVAISLSAQTTDIMVNKATKGLFALYPTPEKMALASVEEIEKPIQILGLFRNKAKNLSLLSKRLVNEYQGAVPLKKEELVTLPGVGNKTAGVFLIEIAHEPNFPVDTHIKRVSYRLGYARKDDEPLDIEKKLKKRFPSSEWIFLHHALIYFGREICHAQNPDCQNCPLVSGCPHFKRNSSTKGR